MKKILVKVVSIVLSLMIAISICACEGNNGNDTAESDDLINDTLGNDATANYLPTDEFFNNLSEDNFNLTPTQYNSIAMLNYLATLAQEIDDSKNSRMFLEEAYAALINNTNPETVNEITESHLASLLDIIEKYRIISVKRDRLEYLYEQNKANAIKKALPNPLSLMNVLKSRNIFEFALSVGYMAFDSISSYSSNVNEASKQFLTEGWELDDEEAANLHDSRKRAFMFMIDIVREEEIPGNLALNEEAVDNFVKWKNKDNSASKLQFFESNEETYCAFGEYWIELSKCYFECESYENCIAAIQKYEELHSNIFRKDFYLAHAIPLVIASAYEVYDDEEYIPFAEQYVNTLIDNTTTDDWELRYFAAEIYIDLFAKTQDEKYLKKSYDLALNNVNNLIDDQKNLTDKYLADVQEEPVPDSATDEEKKQIKEYNKLLKENRKTELPPAYEPLVINCELLFRLVGTMQLSDNEKEKIEAIIGEDNNSIFLTSYLKENFSFNAPRTIAKAEYKKDQLVIPANFVSENSRIVATVTVDGVSTVYEDWNIDSVKRNGNKVTDFVATFKSKEAGKQKWSENSTVKIEIFEGSSTESMITLNYVVTKYQPLIVTDIVEFQQGQ